MQKLLRLVGLLLYVAGFILITLWIVFPKEWNYEPIVALIGLLIGVVETLKRLEKRNKLQFLSKYLVFNMFAKKTGVSYIIPKQETWGLGLTGFFIRSQGITVVIVTVTLLLTYITVWQNDKDTYYLPNIPIIYIIYGFFTATSLIYISLAKYVKYRTVRSLKMKSYLHELLHTSRDEICSLLERTIGLEKIRNKKRYLGHEQKHLLDYSDSTCDIIQKYFKLVTGDGTITCAIRVASSIPDSEDCEIGYFTVGRSNNMNSYRAKTSEYISGNEGTPRFFSEIDPPNQGLLFYYDLDLAEKNGAYQKTKNDYLYKNDIKTTIVAPINGWSGEGLDLIALLYINSKTSKIINPKDAELVAFTADTIATIYTAMFARLHSVNNMPPLIGENNNNE